MSNTPKKVLVASYLEEEFIEQIRREVPEAEIINRPDLIGKPRYVADHSARIERTPQQEAEWRALLAEAEILFDFDHSHQEDLPELAPHLKWIQATSAGIGQFVKRLRYGERTDWVFTTASGVHARPLAEFALMAMLFFAKNYPYLQEEKSNKHWARYCATELNGKTLAIIGLGRVGREVARMAKAFDMRVIGNRRDPNKGIDYIDQLYPPSEITPLLRQADFLVLAVPHTPETEKRIGAAEIKTLPNGAVLINIARGAVVDQAALIAALQDKHLGGAALDVFEVEPLPADNPLWDMPNVIISPHSASTAETENAKITRIFCDNLKAFLAGKPLSNVLDVERLY